MINNIHSNTVSDVVQKIYINFRSSGASRACALEKTFEYFHSEMEDLEECFFVMTGIVVSMASRKELTVDIANKTIRTINQLREVTQSDSIGGVLFSEIEQLLDNTANFGDEASYESLKRYQANWKIGEVFSHVITDPISKPIGIYNWLIIFYKSGEFTDELGTLRHLMYVSVCPPEKKPSTAQQLQDLGFLKMMRHDSGWDYLTQITVKNKKEESGYELTSIGLFPNLALPHDRIEEDPLSAMPLFGRLKKSDIYPCYEMQICRLYKRYGTTLNQAGSNNE